MADFVFTSPGVKFKERDLTYVTRNVGITTLGVVGETLKGPAFEPIFIQDKREFMQRFGGQSTKKLSNGSLQYQLPYVANSYLSESSQLWVTRVLGLSGYDAGDAWAITLEAGYDPETVVTGATTTSTKDFSDYIYGGVTLNTIGDKGSYDSGYTKNLLTSEFTKVVEEFEVISMTGGSGTVSVSATTYTASMIAGYDNMVVAIIRSRGRVEDVINGSPITTWETQTLSMTDNTTINSTGNLFGSFKLTASNTASTETYVVSLDPNSSSYLPKVIGKEPKDKKTKIWVEFIYPDLIKYLDATGIGYGVKTTLINPNTDAFTNYMTNFKTPETPWVVSQLRGETVEELFKFISISDGDAANSEIKISITDINPITGEFNVIVRNFYDTDDNQLILESFTKCTLNKTANSYIGRRIGTSDGVFSLNSNYVMVEVAEDYSDGSFPAGFQGYQFKDYSDFGAITPMIKYKTEYADDDNIRRTFLGISEHAYDTDNSTSTGINQNFFNFYGTGGFIMSDGFHMDIDVSGITTSVNYQGGIDSFKNSSDVLDPNNKYFNINTRKFTLAPAGGFDGWNVNRGINGYERSFGDLYRERGIYDGVDNNETPVNDFQAWETAINTFANPEEVTINLFSTPGLNWSDNNILVRNTIEMIETQRTDSLYIIDSPDTLDVSTTSIGDGGRADVIAATEIVNMLKDAEIDSSYACTYFPWIQIRDTQNNVNVFMPPTGEVVKAIAYTDNSSFPWFAPAGLSRGVTDAIKSKYKLSQDARDILYNGRINPMVDHAQVGTAIFGQKTLQTKESALDRINVRRLLLQIKVLISNIAIRLVFEQNDQATIDQFLQKTTPILDSIKRERGLQDFRIKMDDTNNTPETRDRNELYGEIFLKPTRAVEFIGITFTITPSGASFEDVGA